MDVEFMNAKFDQLLERDILPYFNDNIKGIPIDEITAKMKSLFRDSVGEKIFENLTEFENRVHDAFVLFEEWLVAEKKIDKQEVSHLQKDNYFLRLRRRKVEKFFMNLKKDWRSPKVDVYNSFIEGSGMFANSFIKKGEKLIIFGTCGYTDKVGADKAREKKMLVMQFGKQMKNMFQSGNVNAVHLCVVDVSQEKIGKIKSCKEDIKIIFHLF